MPTFKLLANSAVSAVTPPNARIVGNLAGAYEATLYGNRYWPQPLWQAFLVPGRVHSIFGDQAARSWGIKNGDPLYIMFYDARKKEVNGYQTIVRVTSLFTNPIAIFLSWQLTQKYFTIDLTVGSESITAKQPPLGQCVWVNYP